MQVPKIHRAECPTYGVTKMGRTFNSTRKNCEHGRREPLGGSGGMPRQKIFKSESLKTRHFQHSQADSCVKKVPKIDRYFFLTLTKKRCHQL